MAVVVSTSSLRPPADPVIAERGADTLVTQCLRLAAGETLQTFTWGADDVFALVARAVERAGGVCVRVPLEPHADSPPAALAAALAAPLAGGATATVYLGDTSAPTAISIAVMRAVLASGARHLHLPRVDLRLLSQSVRADPDLLALLNDRVSAFLRPPVDLRVTSDAGTALDVSLAASYPLIGACGRPPPGQMDNLPSGMVFTHPAQIAGTFVADRAAAGGTLVVDAAALRRHPLTLTLAGGKVTRVTGADRDAVAAVETFLASHAYASRVGTVAFGTNYLARSEIGNDVQDGLMPGMKLTLGYAASHQTRAPFEAPVQMRFAGRKHTIEARGQRMVAAGRFESGFVEGIDPFR